MIIGVVGLGVGVGVRECGVGVGVGVREVVKRKTLNLFGRRRNTDPISTVSARLFAISVFHRALSLARILFHTYFHTYFYPHTQSANDVAD